jgi:hypothetical protein
MKHFLQSQLKQNICFSGNTKWDGAKIVDGKCFVFVKYPKVTWNEAQVHVSTFTFLMS